MLYTRFSHMNTLIDNIHLFGGISLHCELKVNGHLPKATPQVVEPTEHMPSSEVVVEVVGKQELVPQELSVGQQSPPRELGQSDHDVGQAARSASLLCPNNFSYVSEPSFRFFNITSQTSEKLEVWD